MTEVYCDGGSRGNPGPAAFGFVIKKKDRILKRAFGYLGIETNNFAEYTALIEALSWLQKDYSGEELTVFLDSKLVVSQMSGIYKIKNAKIRDLVVKVRQLEPTFGKIIYQYIPREQNREADRLVNLALNRVTTF